MDPLTHKTNRFRDRTLAIGAVVAAFVVLAAVTWLTLFSGGDDRRRWRAAANSVSAPPPHLPPQTYKPLTPENALAENATLPFSTAPIEPAPPLFLPADRWSVVGRRSSLDCLTAAIYYEAGNEIEQGKRGVAQVILNRARHPAFPNTICGVVYQGSERQTGCQFTFTCDGSLDRRPSRGGWDAARRIAVAALSGAIEPGVGMATHYHADYVVPYWAPSLAKISKLGAHIFYRWPGGWGRRAAFRQSVSQEQLLADQAQFDPMAELGLNPPLMPTAPPLTPSGPRLRADEDAGTPATGAATVLVNAAPSAIKADDQAAKLAADDARGTLKAE